MKRKIKDFSDFIECIKEGKNVTGNNGKWLYFFENGFICCKHKEGFCLYNTTVEDENLSQMEVEEEEPLKIEVGKLYRTRNGKKAYCFFVDKYFRFCKFVIDGFENVIGTNKDGEEIISGRFENERFPADIVGYWEE